MNIVPEWTKELARGAVGGDCIPTLIKLKDDGERYVTLAQGSDLIVIDMADIPDVINLLSDFIFV